MVRSVLIACGVCAFFLLGMAGFADADDKGGLWIKLIGTPNLKTMTPLDMQTFQQTGLALLLNTMKSDCIRREIQVREGAARMLPDGTVGIQFGIGFECKRIDDGQPLVEVARARGQSLMVVADELCTEKAGKGGVGGGIVIEVVEFTLNEDQVGQITGDWKSQLVSSGLKFFKELSEVKVVSST